MKRGGSVRPQEDCGGAELLGRYSDGGRKGVEIDSEPI